MIMPAAKRSRTISAGEALSPTVLYSAEAERAVLGCMMAQPVEVIDEATMTLSKEDFFVPAHQEIFAALREMHNATQAIDVMTVHQWLTDRKMAEAVGSPGILAELLVGFATHLNVGSYIRIVKDKSLLRCLQSACSTIVSDISEMPDSVPDVLDRAENAIRKLATHNGHVTRLSDRIFNLATPPPKTDPVLWLGNVIIGKPGDLVVIAGQVKTGKSAIIGALIASAFAGSGDFLGWTTRRAEKHVLHIDTEQTPEDHYDLLERAMARGQIDTTPPELWSYCLTEDSTALRKKKWEDEILRLAKTPTGLSLAILDGVADIAIDPNDQAEAIALVDWLYGLAIRAHAVIVLVLHENPGDNQHGKTRGHLGSQLERKAAANLRLQKDEAGICSIFTERSRRGFLAKKSAPRFTWDSTREMHLSCSDAPAAADPEKARKLYEIFCDVFSADAPAFRHTNLVKQVMSRASVSERTAKTRIDEARNNGILNNLLGSYSLNHDFTTP